MAPTPADVDVARLAAGVGVLSSEPLHPDVVDALGGAQAAQQYVCERQLQAINLVIRVRAYEAANHTNYMKISGYEAALVKDWLPAFTLLTCVC